MKTLFIVRHGKSDWSYPDVRDIDRSLKERGVNDGYRMAGRMLEKNLIPDLLISSTAARATQTALIFLRVLDIADDKLVFDKNLYLADEDDILSVIYAVDDSVENLMIFGHNPGFTYLANSLSNLNIMNVPTTGLVSLKFDIKSWNEISRGKIAEEEFDFPRNG